MSHWQAAFGKTGRFLAIAATGLAVAISTTAPAVAAEHRGIWMHASYIKTPAAADRCVELMDRANLNAVYLLVWYWGGQAGFKSQFCPMLEGVQEGYDPLGYMIQQCHQRQIEVHAWFVNGSYGNPTPRQILDRHPDWAVDTGNASDGLWYDLGQRAVRRFQSDLMIEALTRYDLDGIHFDFIRYNGPAVCYCKQCQAEFAARYDCGPMEKMSRSVYPFATALAGNPVAGPTTAQVLAQFSDGTPAIATNELGQGKVLLLNWHALRPMLPPVVETWKRTLRQWNAASDQVFVMDTAANRKRYGDKGTKEAEAVLRKLGCGVQVVGEERLSKLGPGALVVLSDVYEMPDDFAGGLERFVRDGGRLVVIDGPVHAMRNASLQRVLGMKRTGSYINRLEVVQPVGTSELVPSDGVQVDLTTQRAKLEKWAEYRKAGVTELVRDVYQRAKQAKPRAQVTAAVFSTLASSDRVFQDWPRWIREGIVDYVIPMAYTPKNEVLSKQLEEWKTLDPRLERIVPGLCINSKGDTSGDYAPRDVDLILTQYRMCRDAGAWGVNFYALDNTDAQPMLLLTEPLIAAWRAGPFAGKAAVHAATGAGPSP